VAYQRATSIWINGRAQRAAAKAHGSMSSVSFEREDHPRAGVPMHFLRIADCTFVQLKRNSSFDIHADQSFAERAGLTY
jgi:hypothetical protein